MNRWHLHSLRPFKFLAVCLGMVVALDVPRLLGGAIVALYLWLHVQGVSKVRQVREAEGREREYLFSKASGGR